VILLVSPLQNLLANILVILLALAKSNYVMLKVLAILSFQSSY